MGRLIKLSRRIAASGAILAGASVLGQAVFTTAPAKAANPLCTDLPGYFIVSGSSAVRPTIAKLGQKLASSSSTLVYSSQGSCTGVAAILGTPPTSAGTATYWDAAGTALTCDLAGSTPVDVGASDVFPTSCPTVKGDALSKAGVGDFHNFFAQVMEFIVPGGPGGSDQKSISAEAAYLTFGFGNSGDTPWNNQNLFLIRNATSGTQIMLSKAIGLDVSKWIGNDDGSATNVFNDIKNRQVPDPANPSGPKINGDPKKMIGIVSSGESNQDPVNVARLAFQATGQTCAYWADSGLSEKDKKYVRDGHYPVWGPLHVLAKVDGSGEPTSAGAKKVIDFLSSSDTKDTETLDLEMAANVVPLCAMKVTRSSEMGPLSSYQPTGDCGCYFDKVKKAGGAPAECKTCEADAECSGDRPVCNYGFCEVK
jgi:ABC-type phosphate transport system substrate-binding protein